MKYEPLQAHQLAHNTRSSHLLLHLHTQMTLRLLTFRYDGAITSLVSSLSPAYITATGCELVLEADRARRPCLAPAGLPSIVQAQLHHALSPQHAIRVTESVLTIQP